MEPVSGAGCALPEREEGGHLMDGVSGLGLCTVSVKSQACGLVAAPAGPERLAAASDSGTDEHGFGQ